MIDYGSPRYRPYTSEPPSATCPVCGLKDACDCEDAACPECGVRCQAPPDVHEFICDHCGTIFNDFALGTRPAKAAKLEAEVPPRAPNQGTTDLADPGVMPRASAAGLNHGSKEGFQAHSSPSMNSRPMRAGSNPGGGNHGSI